MKNLSLSRVQASRLFSWKWTGYLNQWSHKATNLKCAIFALSFPWLPLDPNGEEHSSFSKVKSRERGREKSVNILVALVLYRRSECIQGTQQFVLVYFWSFLQCCCYWCCHICVIFPHQFSFVVTTSNSAGAGRSIVKNNKVRDPSNFTYYSMQRPGSGGKGPIS